jgi:hypothetical protein
MTEKLQAAPPDLRRQLDDALRAGSDTAQIRQSIAETEQALAERAQQQAQRRARDADAQAAATDQLIDAMTSGRLQEMRANMPDVTLLSSEAKGLKMQAREHPEHRLAVAELETNQRALNDALHVVETKDRDLQTISDRLAELDGRRNAMAIRRARGDTRPEDAGELALLEMDLAGLRILHDAASGAISAAQDRAKYEHERVNAAQSRLEFIERVIRVDELLHHLAHLDAVASKVLVALDGEIGALSGEAAAGAASTLAGQASGLSARLLRVTDHIEALSKSSGRVGAPIWGPPKPLLTSFRRLAAARGEL